MKNSAQWLPRRGPVALDRERRPLTQESGWIEDRSAWCTYEEARAIANDPNNSCDGYGFALTSGDPYFCIDIDDCLIDGNWSPFAQELCVAFRGAHIEVSGGGRGLHIFGSTSAMVPHGSVCNGVPGCSKLELYTSRHFCIVTDRTTLGDGATDCTAAFLDLCQKYFPPSTLLDGDADWTESPCDDWRGPTDDKQLIANALRSRSTRSSLGLSACFSDLWTGRTDSLARCYPGKNGTPYDASSCDAALASHLAFWTGRDCKRIESLMWESQLSRDKWERAARIPPRYHPQSYRQQYGRSATNSNGQP